MGLKMTLLILEIKANLKKCQLIVPSQRSVNWILVPKEILFISSSIEELYQIQVKAEIVKKASQEIQITYFNNTSQIPFHCQG
jgi:hypothetical protein